METHPELGAMNLVFQALSELDDDAAVRVLRWVIDLRDLDARFESTETFTDPEGSQTESPNSEAKSNVGRNTPRASNSVFDEFADLYHAASPSSNADKVLVAAYWEQVIQGQNSFQSLRLNNQLRDLGHQVGQISRVIVSQIEKKPAAIIQLKRNGSSKQSRKTYKLTDTGIRQVRQMINGFE